VLLYAYGFAVPNNPFDTVSFKLVGGSNGGNGNSTEAQSFSITAGGIGGVPKVSDHMTASMFINFYV